MYDINLIRNQIVPHHHKRVMFSVMSFTLLAFAVTGFSVVFFSMANMRVIDVYAKELRNLEEDLTQLYPGNPTREELSLIFSRIEPDLKEISAGVGSRVQMTTIWQGIAEAVPDSVWLTGVTLRAPDDATPKGRDGAVILEGKATAPRGKRGSALIRRFAGRLQSNEILARHVSDAKYVETGLSEINDVEVIGFEIVCKLR